MKRYLAFAVALCFVCHGILAVRAATIYYAEWNVWIQHLFPADPYFAARIVLTVAGCLDILTGLLFVRRSPPRLAFAWAIGWGCATAVSRLYFLGAPTAGVWLGVALPLSEALARTANFALPLVLWRGLKVERAMPAVVAATMAALALRYLADAFGPGYPYELLKRGEPLWFFHAAGVTACLGALALWKAPRWRWLVIVLVVGGYGLHEAFDLLVVQSRRAPWLWALATGEHAAVYAALAAWARFASAEGVRHASVEGRPEPLMTRLFSGFP